MGGGLERYGARFDAVEINSTFHRTHRTGTLERWAAAVNDGFRFAVKLPKTITHEAKLVDVEAQTGVFLAQIAGLGDRLGPVLIQLPPSLPFEPDRALPLCRRLQEAGCRLACEPRHASWFEPTADAWMVAAGVARVAADPARHPGAGSPGGWRGLTYYRWHGSPRTYYSAYEAEALGRLARHLAEDPAPEIWCVFDNTASGAATGDALMLQTLLPHIPGGGG